MSYVYNYVQHFEWLRYCIFDNGVDLNAKRYDNFFPHLSTIIDSGIYMISHHINTRKCRKILIYSVTATQMSRHCIERLIYNKYQTGRARISVVTYTGQASVSIVYYKL